MSSALDTTFSSAKAAYGEVQGCQALERAYQASINNERLTNKKERLVHKITLYMRDRDLQRKNEIAKMV